MNYTANDIRKADPQGTMTLVSGTNTIEFQNGVVFKTETRHERTKLWNKLKRMGYVQYHNSSSDEFDGLAAADPNEVFNCTIISG